MSQPSLLPGDYSPHPDDEARARDLEASETPLWAAEAILRVEIMPRIIVDPCCGRMMLSNVAHNAGYDVVPFDIYDWIPGNEWAPAIMDFLDVTAEDLANNGVDGEFGVLMNSPFSKAQEFFAHAKALGARKIIAFKQFSWWESGDRWKAGGFWEKNPPNRIYVCADRATCWRFDIPADQQKSSTNQAYAWFVWERGHPRGTVIHRIKKGEPGLWP